MKKLFSFFALASSLLAMSSLASTTVVPQGKIAVIRTGDGTLAHGVGNGVGQDFTYLDVYDTSGVNQGSTLYTFPFPTNVLWINGHAGTEGGGISRSADRSVMAIAGYTGPMNYPASTPSSAFVTNGGVVSAAFTRGFGVLDPIAGTFNLAYSGYGWFGLPTGVTQNNPTGIATPEGTNFYGTGNVTPTLSAAAGGVQYLLYSNYTDPYVNGNTPYAVSSTPSGAGEARIIGGKLYIIATNKKGGGTTTNGIYTFVDQANNNAPVPFPWDPFVPSPVEHIVSTNLFINFDQISTKTTLAPLSFDMNTNGTILYAADQTFGIYKFVNNGVNWSQAYFYSPTNLGTLSSPAAQQGIFSICVDFSSANPVIYATTMENGTVSGYGNSQGNPNENRLLRIVDTGSSPGTTMVAQTLATAQNTNVTFRGVDFTPDLRPYFLSSPVSVVTTNNGTANFNAPATAPSSLAVTYQWYQSPSTPVGNNSSTLSLSSLQTSQSGNSYFCVATDDYGSVTSSVANLTVNFVAQAPGITNAVANVSGHVNDTITFAAITPTGTTPFTYQWYFNGAALTDGDGSKYTNSQTAALTIFGLTTADAGNYSIKVSNVQLPAASNVVDILSVSYVAPVIGGQPLNVTTLAGAPASLTATVTAGTTPLTYQWFKDSSPLSDTGDFTGSLTSTLSINPTAVIDSGTYYVRVTNPNNQSANSSNAVVTINTPPPHSAVNYSNGVYTQNFDSLPFEANRSINAFNNPESPDSINGVSYSLATPSFDFAYPVLTTGYLGGLGLSNTMSGWYGAAFYPTPTYYAQIAAQDGDQTTGGDIFYGNLGATSSNRALGLQTTSSAGATAFALKLINSSTNTLKFINLGFVAEQWRQGINGRTMSVGYTIDNTASTFSLLGGDSISNSTLIAPLAFSFPTAVNASAQTALDGTLPANQQNLAVNNYPISDWTPGSALWLIWGMDFLGVGKGNGYGIDNLYFSASTTPVLSGATYSSGGGLSFHFNSAPSVPFTVYSTTNLMSPNWNSVGTPTETSHGSYSTYQFNDASPAGNTRYYKVTSP